MSMMDDEFMDLGEIREFVKRMGPTATKKLIHELTGVPVRMSQGIITAIDPTARQCTFKEFGDPVGKTNVAWNSYGVIPKIGEPVWCLKWGNDGMIIGVSSGVMFSTPTMGRVPSAKLERTSNFTVANNTITAVPMEAKRWDTDNIVDAGFPGTNPTRLIPQRVGLYYVTCGAAFAGNNVGRRIIDLKWVGFGFITRGSMQEPATGTGDAGFSLSAQIWIDTSTTPGSGNGGFKGSLGNGFEMTAFQTSGGNLDLAVSVPIFIDVFYLGPEP